MDGPGLQDSVAIRASMAAADGDSRIHDRQSLEAALDRLMALDPGLAGIRASCGEIPLRLSEPGFAALTHIVCGQLLSVAAAKAIHDRVVAHFGAVTGAALLERDNEQLYGLGLSRAKIRSLKAIALAEADGRLDLAGLHLRPAAEAHATLIAQPGIGPWTAELYLLRAGHMDIFPAGDLALRKMVGTMGRFEGLPQIAETAQYAARWRPFRSAAARLLWQHFAAGNSREGTAL